jgi:phospholipase D-like protein
MKDHNEQTRCLNSEIVSFHKKFRAASNKPDAVAAINLEMYIDFCFLSSPSLISKCLLWVGDGSENISTQSLDQNRELGIIVSDTNVLSKLQSTFQTDWGVSQGV